MTSCFSMYGADMRECYTCSQHIALGFSDMYSYATLSCHGADMRVCCTCTRSHVALGFSNYIYNYIYYVTLCHGIDQNTCSQQIALGFFCYKHGNDVSCHGVDMRECSTCSQQVQAMGFLNYTLLHNNNGSLQFSALRHSYQCIELVASHICSDSCFWSSLDPNEVVTAAKGDINRTPVSTKTHDIGTSLCLDGLINMSIVHSLTHYTGSYCCLERLQCYDEQCVR